MTGSAGLGFLFSLICLNLVLLVYGNVLVYQARSVPTKYNEVRSSPRLSAPPRGYQRLPWGNQPFFGAVSAFCSPPSADI